MKADLKEEPNDINSHPWIVFFLIDWLPFRDGGEGRFKIGPPRSTGWKNFGHRWTRGWGVLKIGRFSWTSYVHHTSRSE